MAVINDEIIREIVSLLDLTKVRCSICLEEVKNPKILRCQHIFCAMCLDKYLSQSPKKKIPRSCPNCKATIAKRAFYNCPDVIKTPFDKLKLQLEVQKGIEIAPIPNYKLDPIDYTEDQHHFNSKLTKTTENLKPESSKVMPQKKKSKATDNKNTNLALHRSRSNSPTNIRQRVQNDLLILVQNINLNVNSTVKTKRVIEDTKTSEKEVTPAKRENLTKRRKSVIADTKITAKNEVTARKDENSIITGKKIAIDNTEISEKQKVTPRKSGNSTVKRGQSIIEDTKACDKKDVTSRKRENSAKRRKSLIDDREGSEKSDLTPRKRGNSTVKRKNSVIEDTKVSARREVTPKKGGYSTTKSKRSAIEDTEVSEKREVPLGKGGNSTTKSKRSTIEDTEVSEKRAVTPRKGRNSTAKTKRSVIEYTEVSEKREVTPRKSGNSRRKSIIEDTNTEKSEKLKPSSPNVKRRTFPISQSAPSSPIRRKIPKDPIVSTSRYLTRSKSRPSSPVDIQNEPTSTTNITAKLLNSRCAKSLTSPTRNIVRRGRKTRVKQSTPPNTAQLTVDKLFEHDINVWDSDSSDSQGGINAQDLFQHSASSRKVNTWLSQSDPYFYGFAAGEIDEAKRKHSQVYTNHLRCNKLYSVQSMSTNTLYLNANTNKLKSTNIQDVVSGEDGDSVDTADKYLVLAKTLEKQRMEELLKMEIPPKIDDWSRVRNKFRSSYKLKQLNVTVQSTKKSPNIDQVKFGNSLSNKDADAEALRIQENSELNCSDNSSTCSTPPNDELPPHSPKSYSESTLNSHIINLITQTIEKLSVNTLNKKLRNELQELKNILLNQNSHRNSNISNKVTCPKCAHSFIATNNSCRIKNSSVKSNTSAMSIIGTFDFDTNYPPLAKDTKIPKQSTPTPTYCTNEHNDVKILNVCSLSQNCNLEKNHCTVGNQKRTRSFNSPSPDSNLKKKHCSESVMSEYLSCEGLNDKNQVLYKGGENPIHDLAQSPTDIFDQSWALDDFDEVVNTPEHNKQKKNSFKPISARVSLFNNESDDNKKNYGNNQVDVTKIEPPSDNNMNTNHLDLTTIEPPPDSEFLSMIPATETIAAHQFLRRLTPPPGFGGSEEIANSDGFNATRFANNSTLPNATILKKFKTPTPNVDVKKLKNGTILNKSQIEDAAGSSSEIMNSIIERTPVRGSERRSRNILRNNISHASKIVDNSLMQEFEEEMGPLSIVKSNNPVTVHDGSVHSKQMSILNFVSDKNTNSPKNQTTPRARPSRENQILRNVSSTSCMSKNSSKEVDGQRKETNEQSMLTNSYYMPTPCTQMFERLPIAFSTPISKKKPKISITCSRLNYTEKFFIQGFCEKFNLKYSNEQDHTVTHLITDVDENNRVKDNTLKFVHAVAFGKWALSMQWAKDSYSKNELQPEDMYEILDENGDNGPKNGRLHQDLMQEKLLNYDICLVNLADFNITELTEILNWLGARVVFDIEDLALKSERIRIGLTGLSSSCENIQLYKVWLDKYGIQTVVIDWLAAVVLQDTLPGIEEFSVHVNGCL